MGQIIRLDDKLEQLLLRRTMKIHHPLEFELTPIHYKKIKMVVPINGDSMWKRIKDKLGFKDDHADKNYQR